MKLSGLAAFVALGLLAGSALAEVEPTSVKASLKLSQSATCDFEDNCEIQVKLAVSGAQTFALDSSISDQFTPDTQISISVIDFGDMVFQLSQDPNYQTGDESVKINISSSSPSGSEKVSMKMSWKNGQCKVAMKLQLQGESGDTIASKAQIRVTALPPGNPESTQSMFVRILNGMTELETARGYFAVSTSESTKLNPLPNNGYSRQATATVKSRYQVGQPVKLVF